MGIRRSSITSLGMTSSFETRKINLYYRHHPHRRFNDRNKIVRSDNAQYVHKFLGEDFNALLPAITVIPFLVLHTKTL